MYNLQHENSKLTNLLLCIAIIKLCIYTLLIIGLFTGVHLKKKSI